jgi:hypothetical protein
VPDVIHVVQATPSHNAVQAQINLLTVAENLDKNFIRLCDLLLEVQENKYFHAWGFARFSDWVERGSNLDISSRTAYSYLSIVKKANQLGISRARLNIVSISKLKEIFSLDALIYGDEIKDLLTQAVTLKLTEVKKAVAWLKQADGEEPTVFMTIKIEESVKKVLDEAFELARRNYGNTVTSGDEVEISDSRCVEILALSYVQDPNNTQEK